MSFSLLITMTNIYAVKKIFHKLFFIRSKGELSETFDPNIKSEKDDL